MSVGVMEDYKLRDLRASHTQGPQKGVGACKLLWHSFLPISTTLQTLLSKITSFGILEMHFSISKKYGHQVSTFGNVHIFTALKWVRKGNLKKLGLGLEINASAHLEDHIR